jgi:hypothetical protein
MVVRGNLATGGGARTLRMGQIRHMKELRNRGATSNARFRVVPLTLRSTRRRKGRR